MASVINKYRIYCETDNSWKYSWGTSPLTECPDNPGHTVNTNSQTVVALAKSKTITDADSPYFIRTEFLICDTTNNDIDVRLINATKSENGIARIKKSAEPNNVNIYNGTDITPIFTISNLNELLVLKSDGVSWNQISIHNENDIDNNFEELSSNLINNILLSKTHNKGDLITSDDRSNALLPVGNDGEVLIADSSTVKGLKWGTFTIDSNTEYNLLSSTNNWSTTNTSFTEIPGMTVTPESGTYFVSFSSGITTSSNKTKATFAIFNDDNETIHSERGFADGKSNGSSSSDDGNDSFEDVVNTQSIETVTCTEVINVKAKRSNSGSIKFKKRNLILLKLS